MLARLSWPGWLFFSLDVIKGLTSTRYGGFFMRCREIYSTNIKLEHYPPPRLTPSFFALADLRGKIQPGGFR